MTIRRASELPKPTEAELAILGVLWERGSGTVRDVHEALYANDGGGYTTALKLMQVMHAKGLVERDDSQRAHVFRAVVSKERTQKRFLSDIVDRVFDGSAAAVVLRLFDCADVQPDDLKELRQIIRQKSQEKTP